MKALDILKKVGGGVIKQFFPAAGAIIDVVNAVLPDGKKLPEDATGDQVQEAIKTLPPEQQAQILNKQFDVEIEKIKGHSKDLAVMAEVDKAGASTRPDIAYMMAWLVAYGVVVAISAVAWAIIQNTLTIENAWPAILAILGTPTALLLRYFGKRSEEKIARYAAATGNKITSGVASLIGMFKK